MNVELTTDQLNYICSLIRKDLQSHQHYVRTYNIPNDEVVKATDIIQTTLDAFTLALHNDTVDEQWLFDRMTTTNDQAPKYWVGDSFIGIHSGQEAIISKVEFRREEYWYSLSKGGAVTEDILDQAFRTITPARHKLMKSPIIEE